MVLVPYSSKIREDSKRNLLCLVTDILVNNDLYYRRQFQAFQESQGFQVPVERRNPTGLWSSTSLNQDT